MNDTVTEVTFTKKQFMSSKQFLGWKKDLLAALLEDNKVYTMQEAEQAIENYLKKGVK